MNLLNDTWEFLTAADSWTGQRGILERGRAHVWISLVATLIAAAIAIPSAIVLAHRRWLPIMSVAVINVGRAIPSFAIIALLFPLSIQYGFGLGFWPTCVALVALGIPPMFTNTYAGVAGTPPELVEAAEGIGMTGGEVLRKVELPSALPLLFTGVRVSAVQIVATATLGAIVGYECLGSFIVAGLARGSAGQPTMLAGAILVAGLALAVDIVLNVLEPRFTPWIRRVR
ncbi:MAG: ABC transporter permease [Acidimicrobiia bacterium]